jgi:hypothetical protein
MRCFFALSRHLILTWYSLNILNIRICVCTKHSRLAKGSVAVPSSSLLSIGEPGRPIQSRHCIISSSGYSVHRRASVCVSLGEGGGVLAPYPTLFPNGFCSYPAKTTFHLSPSSLMVLLS